MDEQYSPNYTEFVYEKKAEGALRVAKYLLIVGYILFVAAFFLACYITRFIPVFAVCPIFTWILVFFTWRYVSFDVYYTFNHGEMEFGKIRRKKKSQLRRPILKINVKNAILIAPYEVAVTTDEYASAVKKYDFSSKSSSTERLVIVYSEASATSAVIFEKTPALLSLLNSYSKGVKRIGV